MSENDLPPGYARLSVQGATVVARADLLVIAAQAVAQHGTLHAWAGSRPSARPLAGRGTIWAVDAPPTGGEDAGAARWVVRHYRRGGAMRWLRDRYVHVGLPRPLGELRASVAARERGVRTPEVLALAVYPDGPFYRADLVTAEISGAVDLAEALWAERPEATDAAARIAALSATGALVWRLADAGVAHRDLNAKNILIESGDPALPVASVLDLDGCRVLDRPLSWKRRREMQARLERSLRKWERLTRRPLAPQEWVALRGALEVDAEPEPGRG